MSSLDDIGKSVGGHWYFHADHVPSWAMKKVLSSIGHLGTKPFNVVKITKDGVSFLFYRQFMTADFPELVRSYTVRGRKVIERNYNEDNPPIMHRKELLLPKGHCSRARAVRLTKRCEDAGLFANTKIIGRKQVWVKMLNKAGIK